MANSKSDLLVIYEGDGIRKEIDPISGSFVTHGSVAPAGGEGV